MIKDGPKYRHLDMVSLIEGQFRFRQANTGVDRMESRKALLQLRPVCFEFPHVVVRNDENTLLTYLHHICSEDTE